MDVAFKTGAYPAYTLAYLKQAIEEGRGNPKMVAEVARREAVAAGDMSKATPGERLRARR